MVAERSVI